MTSLMTRIMLLLGIIKIQPVPKFRAEMQSFPKVLLMQENSIFGGGVDRRIFWTSVNVATDNGFVVVSVM